MSVRDELGRNVCVYSLISSCMYGPDKCVYSHSREFLPHGWWNHDDDVEKSQQLVLSCAQCLNAPHSLKEIAQQLRVPRLAAGFQRRAYNDLGIRSLDIDREARAKIRAKVRAKAKPMEYEAAATNTTSPSTTRFGTTGNSPFIVVVSLEHEDYYNDILFHLLSSLRAKIQVKQSFKKETALTYLSQPGLAGVYVMDAGIIRKSNSAVLKRLMEYVKDEGGQVCFGGMFPGCINRDEFAEFFKGWGVQWNYGSYHRTTFALNASHPLVSSNSLLLKSYSMKALHVSNISPDVMLYRTTEESRLESFVFAPMKINKPGESPAVAARVGKGWLSFLGDVNGEKGSTGAVMAMLGVLDEIKAPVAVPQEKKPTAVERKDKKEETPPDGKTKGSGAVMGKSKNTEKPPVRQLKEDLVKQDTAPGHFILIIAISAGNSFQDTHKAQLDALQNKVRVEVAVGRHYALQYLSDPNLRGVYVADNSLINFTNSDILEKVVSFAKAGGTVVASGLFPTMTPVERIPEFFGAFDLKWTVGKRRKAEWYLDGRVPLGKWNPSLPETYPVKALAITNLNPKFAVYFPPPEYSDFESPVVRAKVGKGYLGYVGYESPAEPMGTAIILAMFNKLDYTPGPPQRIRKKFVLVLSFDRIEHTREAYSGLLSALANKVEVVHCELSNERIIDLLGSEDLLGVIVMTTDITDPPQAYLLQKLVEFTKGGGTIIFAGFFACDISTLEFMPFFEDNWELPWDMCSYTIEAKLNKNSDFVKSRSRPGEYDCLQR
ncbi:hypothetical protein BDQ17DRAFT_1072795 [Cyathus striatus]|nr:hypothetical protein BDQ17DRAFT_1072795 [Cyathus striatus]